MLRRVGLLDLKCSKCCFIDILNFLCSTLAMTLVFVTSPSCHAATLLRSPPSAPLKAHNFTVTLRSFPWVSVGRGPFCTRGWARGMVKRRSCVPNRISLLRSAEMRVFLGLSPFLPLTPLASIPSTSSRSSFCRHRLRRTGASGSRWL